MQEDPFEVIDEKGVGKLILMSVKSGRDVASNNNVLFKAGVCGEHGGDPKSVRFFVQAGSLTHSLTHSLAYSLTYLLTHSLTHSLTYLLTYLLIYSLI